MLSRAPCWRVAPDGTASHLGYDGGSGGTTPDLVEGPGDVVYSANGSSIDRLGDSMTEVHNLDKISGSWFWLTDFAIGRGGVLYADEIRGNVGLSLSSAPSH